ncbi:bifunctional ornithine acetyltransferase/N-acetylglutamate synthase [Brachybacterium ginsengisoli]|uniref:Arginine biosynthesis bifunctional protein ArgJ n=1 Tax=Brachybacterium ginsengisoli TaxID=1331682 RepID=A0A291GVV3_9MICO|nr:bifunctional glutamate N-acetyltransferase/amino-acid acetyltransferase ArgJ [Brachybacterium ginsengisoli]ATG54340.1 bifunctional ornithine acetyltransferase/N-acetylglutamate synthase [Brachybacterium ginsengisoli]
MSITRPRGFRAVGLPAGIKSTGAADLAVILNDGPRDTAAAVFTSNRVQAAPVLWSRQAIADGRARTVVLNSGGANACTGPEGFADSHRTAEHLAEQLEVSAQDVLVCSTGLIGERLPMEPLLAGITTAVTQLDAGPQADESASRAIMTTDSVPKTSEATTPSGVVVGGIAKGAGMLAPQLATMLVVLTTDADVDAATADAALRAATSTTFDRVDSDACMSTNDTVILLASGASGVTPSLEELTEAVRAVSADLARQLVADAEGASHDVHVVVSSASTEQSALAVAREIARSNLVKAAIFGNDPNWGRIVAAAGCVPEAVAPFSVDDLSVTVNGIQVCRGGGAHRDRSEVDMTPRETLIEVDLGAGDATGDIWTNDLTHDYVEENSAYSS